MLDAAETELYKRCFEPVGVGAYQYVKLLRDAVWCAPTEETHMCAPFRECSKRH